MFKKMVMNRKYYIFMGLLFAGVLTTGCVGSGSSGNFAKLHHDGQVTQMFESLEVNPEYQYFYSGIDTNPSAIVGISKNYNLNSRFWHPVDLTPEQLHKWIFGLAHRRIKNIRKYGSNIIGPKDESIGIWYSLEDWQQWARIEFREPDVVKIGSPINTQNGRSRRR